jgi:uncharacterized OB-fold protein
MSLSGFSLSLKLDYRHGVGRFGPYFAALEDGRALAAQCPSCDRTWFPPRAFCPEHGIRTVDRLLAGTGTIAAVTDGPSRLPFSGCETSGSLVLVAMDGADNLALGRMELPPAAISRGTRVRLAGAKGLAHPAQSACFVLSEEA